MTLEYKYQHSPKHMQHPELFDLYGVGKAGLQTPLPARHTVFAGHYIVALSILECPGLQPLLVNCLQMLGTADDDAVVRHKRNTVAARSCTIQQLQSATLCVSTGCCYASVMAACHCALPDIAATGASEGHLILLAALASVTNCNHVNIYQLPALVARRRGPAQVGSTCCSCCSAVSLALLAAAESQQQLPTHKRVHCQCK